MKIHVDGKLVYEGGFVGMHITLVETEPGSTYTIDLSEEIIPACQTSHQVFADIKGVRLMGVEII